MAERATQIFAESTLNTPLRMSYPKGQPPGVRRGIMVSTPLRMSYPKGQPPGVRRGILVYTPLRMSYPKGQHPGVRKGNVFSCVMCSWIQHAVL